MLLVGRVFATNYGVIGIKMCRLTCTVYCVSICVSLYMNRVSP